MDKYEYRVKTEQMLDFVEQRQYDKAMEIADQIDWKRVKNPSMLNTVSEIYEQNGEYKKSRDVLFIAYDRAPSSRKTVYRLGTLALKTGDIEEATDCYEEYVRIAPRDPNQFILKYKILKARYASLTEQIDALERFKQAEYIEKWACELAMLYDEAGMKTECIEECDDLILWFSEGKYVVQAMELKMKYKPLTPLQQEKYFEQKAIIEKEQEAAEALEEAQEAAEKEILSEELSIDLKDNEEAEEKESEETSEEVEEADETAEETEDVHEQEEAAGIEKETTEDVEEKEELIEEAKEEETEQKTAEENEASESVEEASEEISEEEISEVEETIEEDEDSEKTEVFAQESAEDIIEKTMAMMMGDMSEVILKDDPKADGKEQKVKSAETRELHPDEELSESDNEDIKETSDSEEAKETGAVDAKAEAEEETEASSTEDKPEESSEQVEEEDNRKVREETTIRKAVRGETLLEALKNGFAVARGVDIETKSVYKKDEDLRITGQMKIDEILQAWENKQKENAQAIEDQKKLDEEMIAKKRLEAEKRREEEARRIEEQQRAAEEARRLAEEKAAEEAKKEAERRAEEERILAEQKAEEERRRAIEEAKRAEKERLERLAAEAKAREEEEARRKAEEEAKRKAEEEARIRAEEEAKRLEEEARIRAEEEAKRLAEEAARKAEEARIRAEIEAKLRAEEEARRAAEEAIRKIEEQARLREEEAKRKAEEEARIRAEEEAKARAEMEARIRAEVMAEMEAKLRAEAEARAKAEAEALAFAEEAKRKAEEEAARKAAEEEARKVAEEEARKAAEEEARKEAEEEARKAAEEEARKAAEEEARKAAEEEARKAAEEAKKENEESSNVGIAFEEVAFEEDDFDAEYEESLMDNVDFDFDDDESQKDYDSDLEGLEKELLSEEDALEAELAKLSNELSDDYEIEEPSEEEIQKRIKKGKGGMPFDTGFVVTGRYDLSATSEIGLRAGLTEEQKQLFSYFVPVRGMSEQIVEVLDNDRREKRDGTSKVGNILVIGQKGSGKTVLAVDIVKAIQKQRNLKQGKVAIVTGESLNKKELTTIIQKLRGGAIIIEKAGKLNARTVKELNQLMLKKTGELLVVLEDQSQPLEKLFIANPDFKKRFTSSLNLPVFINDELVTFGQTYAKENGYKLDEMGILALYSRIDVMQREDHAVSVAEVKEIMDEAIDHSQKANVKHFARRVFGKGTDESDRVILKEDDFRI